MVWVNNEDHKVAERIGIYFDLPEDEYHADDAIGSSSVKKMKHNICDWQWERLHPDPPEKRTAIDIGSGVHDLVLLGRDTFLERAVLSPHKEFRTNKAKAWRDATLEAGKIILKKDEFDQVVAAAGAILSSPNLKSEFTNGVPEVSIFWMEGDIRCKARIDYLKIKGNVDLKTFAEKFHQALYRTALQTIADRRYDIQAVHYREARLAMPDLLKRGLVYGKKVPNEAWLAKCANNPTPKHIWVFFKTTGAPMAFSVNPENCALMFELGTMARNAGLQKYRDMLENFLIDEIWVQEEPPMMLHDDDFPPWYGRD